MAKRIGFVDYNLENFHANVYLELLRGKLAERGFEVAGCTGMLEAEGRAWAEKNGVPYCNSIEELDGQVDFYAVLAPSNPEVHEELCRQVFPCGKATYVDKTFTTDIESAERIFALADECGLQMQTSSALRYTNAQERVKELGEGAVQHMITWGGGSSFGEYAIHPVELAISCMGPEGEWLMRRGTGEQSQLLLDFSGGRTAVVNVYTNANTPFAAAVTTGEQTELIGVETGEIFFNLAAAMLDLFESGKATIDRNESLAIRRVLDAAERAEALERFVAL